MLTINRVVTLTSLLSLVALPGAAQSAKSGKPAVPASFRSAVASPKAKIQNSLSILVRASSEVAGRTFTLGEIAEITGGDKARRAALAAVEVGTSPLPGLSRNIYAGDVTVHLRAKQLDSKDVELIAPPTVRITRIGHEMAGDEITRTALEAAKEAIKDLKDASLEAEPVTDKVVVAGGKVRVVAGAYTGRVEAGTLHVPVSLFVDGKLSSTLDVTLHVRRKSSVLVARRTLQPHDIITASDVMLAPTELPASFTRPMLNLEDAIGKRTTRRIIADAPISETMLETPPVVGIGDTLTLEWVVGAIHITAPGLAQSAGAIGDIIRVYATDTHKTLQAVIVDSHTVRIAEAASEPAEEAKP